MKRVMPLWEVSASPSKGFQRKALLFQEGAAPCVRLALKIFGWKAIEMEHGEINYPDHAWAKLMSVL
jgi:hypothetical protein